MSDTTVTIAMSVGTLLVGVVLKFWDIIKQREHEHALALQTNATAQAAVLRDDDIEQRDGDELWAGAVHLALHLLHQWKPQADG